MNNDHDEHDDRELVGTTQAGDDPAGDATSGNDPDHMEDPHKDEHELPEDDETSDGDETGETDGLVTRLRQESGRYRRELRSVEEERDELTEALWTERVSALGVLADPADLSFDADALHDPDRLRELADELVAERPHLRSRRIRHRAGQGEGGSSGDVSLAGILRGGA